MSKWKNDLSVLTDNEALRAYIGTYDPILNKSVPAPGFGMPGPALLTSIYT